MNLWNATLAGLGKGGWGLVFPEFCQLCRDESAKPGDGYIGDGYIDGAGFISGRAFASHFASGGVGGR